MGTEHTDSSQVKDAMENKALEYKALNSFEGDVCWSNDKW